MTVVVVLFVEVESDGKTFLGVFKKDTIIF